MSEVSAARPIWPIVLAFGITQIVGYGTLYYAFAILVPAVAAELEVPPSTLFGVLSAGLLLGGLVAPRLGRAMDRFGAPRLMVLGSAIVPVLLGLLALTPGLFGFAILIVLIQIVSVLVLYDAAFASLAQIAGQEARRSITHLTLIAGFASTLFWPLTGWLVSHLDWRQVYALFALMQLVLVLPLHAWIARRVGDGRRSTAGGGSATVTAPPPAPRPRVFWLVALSFALTGTLGSALSIHMVAVLQATGLHEGAYLAAMLMGPAQVASRLTDALFWRNLHPVIVATIAASAYPLAMLVMLLAPAGLLTAAAFAVLFGVGQGLSSIVKGTVPLALFGAGGYAAMLGRLTRIRVLLGAGAPFVFAAAVDTVGAKISLGILLAIGIAAILPLVLLRRDR